MDSQITEFIGRNYLINELLKAGFEVATPIRDRGVDLIAYIDVDEEINQFVGIPIQLKVASRRSFTISEKYNKFPNLIMAYVWDVVSAESPTVYALTQREAVEIGEKMGYTKTASWEVAGQYSQTRPSQKLIEYMSHYRMTSETWRTKLLRIRDSEIIKP